MKIMILICRHKKIMCRHIIFMCRQMKITLLHDFHVSTHENHDFHFQQKKIMCRHTIFMCRQMKITLLHDFHLSTQENYASTHNLYVSIQNHDFHVSRDCQFHKFSMITLVSLIIS